MKKKNILMAVLEEEYEIIKKLAVEDAIKNSKRVSISAFTAGIVKDYINGNRPPSEKPHNTVSEPLQDSVIESSEIPSTEPFTKESGDFFKDIEL